MTSLNFVHSKDLEDRKGGINNFINLTSREFKAYIDEISMGIENMNFAISGDQQDTVENIILVAHKQLSENVSLKNKFFEISMFFLNVDDNFTSEKALSDIKSLCYKKDDFYIIVLLNCDEKLQEVASFIEHLNYDQFFNVKFIVSFKISDVIALISGKWRVLDLNSNKYWGVKRNFYLFEINKDFLDRTEKRANGLLNSMTEIKREKGAGSDEYKKVINDNAFIAQEPDWIHLFLGNYGAFSRPSKENNILKEIDSRLLSLENKKAVFHLISGEHGVGKSVLTKLVIKRIVRNDNLNGFVNITSNLDKIKICELNIKDENWSRIFENALKIADEKFFYIIYIKDDFFALPEDIRFEVLDLIKLSNKNIYLITTAPSTSFSTYDISKLRIEFDLDVIETRIENVDDEDIQKLINQYIAIYDESINNALVSKVRQDKKTPFVFLRLSLFENVEYMQYVQKVIDTLNNSDNKALAVLLISSITSRFYVHLPISIISEINKGLNESDRLPDDASYYENPNFHWNKIFKIRKGLPELFIQDTIAPINDALAQVIYNVWKNNYENENRRIPIVNKKFAELEVEIYKKINESPETKPILANIFRGIIYNENIEYLKFFSDNYGPAPHGEWTLINAPKASFRWISFLKLDPDKTKEVRISWINGLEKRIKRDPNIVELYIFLFLLKKQSDIFRDPNRLFWVKEIINLEPGYFPILRDMANELLEEKPINSLLAPVFLEKIEEWIEEKSSQNGTPTYRFQIVNSIVSSKIDRIKNEVHLNNALKLIISNYIKNLNNETISNRTIAGIKEFFAELNWEKGELSEKASNLFDYLQKNSNYNNKFMPVLFELFLRIATKEAKSILFDTLEISKIYWKISIKNTGFYGLGHTSYEFFYYLLKVVKERNPTEFEKILNEFFNALTKSSSQLFPDSESFKKSFAYPDFLKGLMLNIRTIKDEIEAEEGLALLSPLFEYFDDPRPTGQIFESFSRIKCNNLKTAITSEDNDIYRQIRLCLPEELNLNVNYVIDDFADLLIEDKIKAFTFTCNKVSRFLRKVGFTDENEEVNKCRSSIFEYLEKNIREQKSAKENSKKNLLKNLRLKSGGALSVLETKGIMPKALNEDQLRIFTEAIKGSIIVRRIPKNSILWLKNVVSSGNAKFTFLQQILDIYWEHILYYSFAFKEKDFRPSYEDFLFLLRNFEIETYKDWWKVAISKLLTFYDKEINRSTDSKGQIVYYKGHNISESTILYNKKVCLDKIMETFLNELKKSSNREIANVFSNILNKNSVYQAKWIKIISPSSQSDASTSFVEFLDRLKTEKLTPKPEYVMQQVKDFSDSIKTTKDRSSSFQTVYKWLKDNANENFASSLLSALLKYFLNEFLQSDENGNLILNICKNNNSIERNSLLISQFINMLCENPKNDLSIKNKKNIEEICKWALELLRNENQIDLASTRIGAYLPQDILKIAFMLNLNLPLKDFEPVFLRIAEAQIENEEGGKLFEHYFSWLETSQINELKNFDVSSYLNWIERMRDGTQAPYILRHLLSFVNRNFERLTISSENIGNTFQIIEYFVRQRLENEGTTLAFSFFVEILVKSNNISAYTENLYKLVIENAHKQRSVFLFVSLIKYIGITEVDQQELLEKFEYIIGNIKTNTDKGFLEAAGNFARTLAEKLNGQSLKIDLLNFLFGFIEENEKSLLSPKFAKILIREKFKMKEIGSKLEIMIAKLKDYNDLAYSIGDYLQYCYDKNYKEQIEKRILYKLLYRPQNSYINLRKPNVGKLIRFLISSCEPSFIQDITKIVKLYILNNPQDFLIYESGESNGKKILKALRAYAPIQDDKSITEDLMELIKNNYYKNDKVVFIKLFKYLIEIWKEQIDFENVYNTFTAIAKNPAPSLSEEIVKCCEIFKNIIKEQPQYQYLLKNIDAIQNQIYKKSE